MEQDASKKLIEYLVSVIEQRDMSAEHHCEHIRVFTGIMIEKVKIFMPEYKLNDDDCKRIVFASGLHDIGKISVPDKILQKPGRLTYDEFQIIKNHTRKGKKIFDHILKDLDKDSDDYKLYKCCSDICMYHHEKYDGEGYPEGLKGSKIPIGAQVVGLLDAYDSLISEKIYKPAYPKEEAFDMIIEGECGVFSERLLEIFKMVRMEIEEACYDVNYEK